MKPLLQPCPAVRSLLVCSLLQTALVAGAADTAREPAAKSASPARSISAARGAPTGKVLPDPALLDGSNQPAEKKSEYGMIGDFELPGDENASRNGKVGGGGGGKGSGTEDGQGGPSIKVTPPGLPLPGVGLPLPGQSGAGAGGGGVGILNQGQSGGSGAPGAGVLNQGQGGADGTNPAAAAGQQGGQPGGTQVGQLGGEGSPGQGADGLGARPQPIAIGDAAMRIPSSTAGVAASAGQVPASANTQNYEKGTGTGGKASGAAGGPNRAEKGRPIPAGL